MSSMEKISKTSILIILLLFTLIPQIKAETLRIGYFKFAPHSMFENGNDIGSAIDYFKLINRIMNVQNVKFISLPNARLFHKLETREIDIGLVFAKNPERAAKYIYPSEPFGTMVMAIALKKSHPLQDIKSVEDVLPLSIGYLKKAYLPNMLRDKRIKFQFLTGDNWTIQNIQKVLKGRIDAALSDYYSLIYEAKKNNLTEKLKFIKITGTEVALYSIMNEKCAKKYLMPYEAALAEIKKEKSYPQAFEDFINKSFK